MPTDTLLCHIDVRHFGVSRTRVVWLVLFCGLLALSVAMPRSALAQRRPGAVVLPQDIAEVQKSVHAESAARQIEQSLKELQRLMATRAPEFNQAHYEQIAHEAMMLDRAAADLFVFGEDFPAPLLLQHTRLLLDAKAQVDRMLEAALAQRKAFALLAANEAARPAIRAYLQIMARLTDLSGRLRYTLYDTLDLASERLAPSPAERQQLLALLTEYRSSIGAVVAMELLNNLPSNVGAGGVGGGEVIAGEEPPARGLRARQQSRQQAREQQPARGPLRGGQSSAVADAQAEYIAVGRAVLRLVAESGSTEVLPELAFLLEQPDLPAELVLEAAKAVRAIGVPQSLPNPTAADLPQPELTAQAIAARLAALPTPPQLAQQRSELLDWYTRRAKHGVAADETYHYGFAIAPGDWLLMRNPSPYNLFTDLSPGLFTHVGVVAAETGSDGVRRLVVIDLAERGGRIPATPVDAFLKRTLNYCFVRHVDSRATAVMGEAAAAMIGNEFEFDLEFRTDRVEELGKVALRGKKIRTYCAGLLLLCAQQAELPRSECFPLVEYPAPGKTAENLGLLGMSIGADFVSPTGALFSPRLDITGRCEPMYDPRREIEEAVFDHFAQNMRRRPLVPSPDLLNALKMQVAKAAQTNPLLSQALASAAGVSQEWDLVSAARAAAVIEMLDSVAFGSSADFEIARDVLLAGSIEALRAEGFGPEDIAAVQTIRQRHGDLYEAMLRGTLSARELRKALVYHYTQEGRRQIDERFFPKDAAAGK